MEKSFEKMMGRPRQRAYLGSLADFSTEMQAPLKHYGVDVESLTAEEKVTTMRMRKARRCGNMNRIERLFVHGAAISN